MPDLTAKVAVITGGHQFDVPNFHRLFRGQEGIDPYIQSIDDYACTSKEVRESYDAVLFYIMMMDGPTDEGLPWYAGRHLTVLSQLGETRQGIFVLHHALLAYPQWPVWNEIVGIEARGFGYHNDQTVSTDIAADHPITRGLVPWSMGDETYTMANADEGSQVLLTCDHPLSMKTVAWVRQYKESRVFCYQAGHDNVTWANPNYREVVRRGILWSAHRI